MLAKRKGMKKKKEMYFKSLENENNTIAAKCHLFFTFRPQTVSLTKECSTGTAFEAFADLLK
jgi:hypothetical protein